MVAAKGTRRRRETPRGFYARALTAAEQADLPAARELEGVDEEIALLRLRLRSALEANPEDLTLMMKGVELLARAVATRYRLSKRAESDLSGAIANVIRSLGDLWPQGPSGE